MGATNKRFKEAQEEGKRKISIGVAKLYDISDLLKPTQHPGISYILSDIATEISEALDTIEQGKASI